MSAIRLTIVANTIDYYERSDGKRFDRCYLPTMLRCEACLDLVDNSDQAIIEHICTEWWLEPLDDYMDRIFKEFSLQHQHWLNKRVENRSSESGTEEQASDLE